MTIRPPVRVIMKMQKPLFSAGKKVKGVTGKEWLLYNRNRSMTTQAVPDADMVRLMGDDLKCYVEVEIDYHANTLRCIQRIEGFSW